MKLLALLLLAVFVATISGQTCGDGLCSLDFAENKVNCPNDCDDICPCRPYCEGRECGPDGCGGSCGTCPFPRACNDIGLCECDRNCIGKECGDDGCNTGDLCDYCGPLQTCGADFLCSGQCTPNCVNPDGSVRQCGNDGCFGSCGECTQIPGQDIRCRDGVCVCRPQCDLIECGSDGCGGNCGACEGDAACVNGFCQYPVLGCCGDGICDPLSEDVCSCRTDCPGCCIDGVCQNIFGETETNCVEDCVDALIIQIQVRETGLSVDEQCTISVTGPNSYSDTLTFNPTSIQWEFQNSGFGTYTFTTNCPSYIGETASHTVTVDTSLIILFVSLKALIIEVRDGQTNALLNAASITITAQFGNAASNGYNWVNPSLSWVPFSGYGSYQFVTSSSGYLTNTENKNVALSTTTIVLLLYKNNLPIIVEECNGAVLSTSTVVASSTTYTSFSATLTVGGTTTTFTHVGYGSYTFSASSSGYENKTQTFTIDQSTQEIRICLARSAFCGDGVCNANEVASPNLPESCFDCGRLRGFIALAVGQKDQLVNITVDVWAHPTNPALYLRRGETVPASQFKTVSDSKGYFNIVSLSFDAPAGSQASGSYSRRFYFRLSGQFTDRTSGNDVVTTLLPLWWNYELINTQWNGRGSLVGTNNSPSLYFFMTPPFSTSDSLIRIILSWGTLISTPSSSLPDLDLVIAGPVNAQSIQQYGSGIVNFANKDLHASLEGLPYAKIITDQAQGYGPEVFDFYGAGTSSLQIGFSDEYASGAPANAYEVWVDRPNSSPNQDASFVFINDTNSFIVIYQNNGVVNQQVLFDERTGVEYAYGFFNRDQWNQVPPTATMWHIVDISLAAGGIVYNGFPGENDPTNQSEQPGCKYSYASQSFISTKVMPCGHVAARGVPGNLVYCPFTLEYPRSKRELSDN